MTRFNVVTGYRRSGTSAMMLALKNSGIPIIGFKYPLKVMDNRGISQDGGCLQPPSNRLKQSNPTGFWEIASIAKQGLPHGSLTWEPYGEAIKILFDVLRRTDADYIEDIIVMARHPRKVLSSRVLTSEIKEADEEKMEMAALAIIIETVRSFNWMADHAKRFKIVIYEELLKDPEKVLTDVCDWLGVWANPKNGAKVIKPELNRSPALVQNGPVMAESDDFYQLLVNRDLDKIMGYDHNDTEVRMKSIYTERVKRENKKEGKNKETK